MGLFWSSILKIAFIPKAKFISLNQFSEVRLFKFDKLHPAFFWHHVFHLSCHYTSHEWRLKLGKKGGKRSIKSRASATCHRSVQQITSLPCWKFRSFTLYHQLSETWHEKNSQITMENIQIIDFFLKPNQDFQHYKSLVAGCFSRPSSNPWNIMKIESISRIEVRTNKHYVKPSKGEWSLENLWRAIFRSDPYCWWKKCCTSWGW